MKIIKQLGLLITVLVLVFFVFNIAIILVISQWRPELKKADAVIVLGAAINTPALKNRSMEGVQLYQNGLADKMVFSGGKISDTDISEAEYMKKVALWMGVEEGFILEEESHNTFENIRNSKKLLPKADSIIIVSDEFHLARAFLLAKRAGFEDVQWSSPEPNYYSAQTLRFYYTREFFAMISYLPLFIFGK